MENDEVVEIRCGDAFSITLMLRDAAGEVLSWNDSECVAALFLDSEKIADLTVTETATPGTYTLSHANDTSSYSLKKPYKTNIKNSTLGISSSTVFVQMLEKLS